MMYAPFAYVGGGGESYAIEFSLLLRSRCNRQPNRA